MLLAIFIKHYLNNEGIAYFVSQWFPAIQEKICKQDGFLSICYHQDATDIDCVNIKLLFTNHETLQKWAQTQDHDNLVDCLDPYRVRDWQVATLEMNTQSEVDTSTLAWETIIPRQVLYEREVIC